MARVVTFIGVVVVLLLVLNLQKFKDAGLNNAPFDFKKAEANYNAKKAEMAAIEKARLESMKKKVVVEEEKPQGPLVVLDTDQLKNGHKLYSKCISCHGKHGQGKKGQKAPRIGGQADWYIVSSLEKMKSGERLNKVMMPYIKKLNKKDFQDLAAYLSKLPWK